MYKKIVLFSALLYTFTQYASDLTPWLEIKPTYFLFSGSSMKDIYNKGGFGIQGCASIPLWDFLDFYGSVGYRHAKGHALNTGEKTSITVVPIDIGLKPILKFYERFYYFFAIGPRCFYFHQHNDSSYVDSKIKNSGIGFFVNTGVNVLFRDGLLVGIFGEYSYENKKIHQSMPNVFSNGSSQISGFAFGISLGYAF